MNTIKLCPYGEQPNLAQRTIFQAMTRATNEERLLVTMLLRSAKPLSMHHLEDIEADLRQMFGAYIG